MRFRIGVAVAVVCVLVALVAAQSPRGQLSGTITDSAGMPLPGVTVEIAGPEYRATLANDRGEFRFTDLLPGTYSLVATLPGFSTVRREGIEVADGHMARVSINLRVGALEETITVSGETPAPQLPAAADTAESRRKAGAAGRIERGGAPRSGGIVALGGTPLVAAGDGRHDQTSFNTETYDRVDENGLRLVANDPLSTFSIDVDTASYANVRRFLNDGRLPPAGAVRTEELINYFRFNYPGPAAGQPFSVTTELAECPWNPAHRLALIGIQGQEIAARGSAPRNLVFLIDVSGSMNSVDKLPLVRNSMRMLVDILTPHDRVAIVVYAGASGLVLSPTPGDRKEAIRHAIARLEAGGSTNGGAGIRLAYEVAQRSFLRGGVNRVILATDGDFNVGVTNQDELLRLIEEKREGGVFLSVLGVGHGNLKDSTMEKLADRGNGNYAYLDSLQEARKVLVREAGATLTTIAKDVKIQIEFNPKAVTAYRLIGYENRVLRNEDFNDDRKDAGEIGAGHSVTALYEIVPPGAAVDVPAVDPLRYQQRTAPRPIDASELATLKVRFKTPTGETSRLITRVVPNRPQELSTNLGFASAVAEFGMLLRGSDYRANASYESVAARARLFRGADAEGYRSEFIRLVDRAAKLHGQQRPE
jgi:Ca-activated chloride channel family protein